MLVSLNIQRLCGCVLLICVLNCLIKSLPQFCCMDLKSGVMNFTKDIEDVHVQFCKYVLEVARNTPNCAALSECGRLPLFVLYMTWCVKYWIRIVQTYDQTRYPKCCYNVLYQLDIAGRHTWATEVKIILYRKCVVVPGSGKCWMVIKHNTFV